MKVDYDLGYQDGESSGYADWVLALDCIDIEVDTLREAIDVIVELQREVQRTERIRRERNALARIVTREFGVLETLKAYASCE